MSETGSTFVSRHTIQVQWGDCDSAQVVFYPNYFRWMEECTCRMFEMAGLTYRAMIDAGGVGIPLVDARVSLIISSSYGEDLEAESQIVKWGNKSFKINHRFYKDGKLAAEGVETRILGARDPEDSNRLKAMPISRDVIERFRQR